MIIIELIFKTFQNLEKEEQLNECPNLTNAKPFDTFVHTRCAVFRQLNFVQISFSSPNAYPSWHFRHLSPLEQVWQVLKPLIGI